MKFTLYLHKLSKLGHYYVTETKSFSGGGGGAKKKAMEYVDNDDADFVLVESENGKLAFTVSDDKLVDGLNLDGFHAVMKGDEVFMTAPPEKYLFKQP